MAKSPEEVEAAMLNSLPEKTGKSLAQWLAALPAGTGPAKHGEIVSWLKTQGVTHGYANLIAHHRLASSAAFADEDSLLTAQYGGGKESLRALYDAICQQLVGFGPDVEFAPKKSYVSVRRSKQFALIQPSTKTRLDVGIQLKGTSPTPRLELSGSFNSMVSHRVRLGSLAEVDAELIRWLKLAYEQA